MTPYGSSYSVVVVVEVGVISLQLHQLYLDDPVLFLLCHQAVVAVLVGLIHVLLHEVLVMLPAAIVTEVAIGIVVVLAMGVPRILVVTTNTTTFAIVEVKVAVVISCFSGMQHHDLNDDLDF